MAMTTSSSISVKADGEAAANARPAKSVSRRAMRRFAWSPVILGGRFADRPRRGQRGSEFSLTIPYSGGHRKVRVPGAPPCDFSEAPPTVRPSQARRGCRRLSVTGQAARSGPLHQANGLRREVHDVATVAANNLDHRNSNLAEVRISTRETGRRNNVPDAPLSCSAETAFLDKAVGPEVLLDLLYLILVEWHVSFLCPLRAWVEAMAHDQRSQRGKG